MRKNCSCDREKLFKFEAEGREFAKLLRLLEQFIQTMKGQNKLRNRMSFLTWYVLEYIRTIKIQIEKKQDRRYSDPKARNSKKMIGKKIRQKNSSKNFAKKIHQKICQKFCQKKSSKNSSKN